MDIFCKIVIIKLGVIIINININTDNGQLHKTYANRVLISQVLSDLNLQHDMPCSGKGICGKCKVKITGDASLPTSVELNKLSKEELRGNIRLSCQTYALGDVTIDYNASAINLQGVTYGVMPTFIKSPITSTDKCKGVAIDIGTTTIAAYLYSFPECICTKTICEKNLQTKFGSDVISRIEYALQGGSKELQKAITSQIENIISKLTPEIPDTIVITGNTIMLHFLTGLSAEGIAKYPFTPESLFGIWQGRTYLPRCISSYVGADITTAIIASDMLKDKTSFLVDIGTNGEMALWHEGMLRCCSTAAGPAFEGAGISHGMIASSGAINRVYLIGTQIHYETIDDISAKGICGTGVIDAISCMKTLGIIDETGYMEEDFQIGSSNVFITPADIRAVQLAKSAISAGIDTLLYECKISYSQIEKFYIAGGFGAYIDKNSAANIGLIPKEILEKVVVLGNAAGNGAAVLLQSREMLEKSEEIAKSAISVELSESPVFMDKYLSNMMF
ncbi:MAG: ASKHA domain-containing protein [Bacillota bacterium]|nr:ASKHA domain-containing protein [Bacillota bacterium]